MPSPFHRHWQFMAPALLGLALAGTARAEAASAEAARAVAPLEVAAADALPASAVAAPAARPATRQIEIGSATEALWALQRASRGTHPRPIDGEQASRSYQRYLQSFETRIPEQYNAGLDLQK